MGTVALRYKLPFPPPPPPPQITSCPSPSWGAGGNYASIYGSGFSGTSPTLWTSGDGGVNFLIGDSWARVVSDSEIDVYADLASLASDGFVNIGVSGVACWIAVASVIPPPAPPTISLQRSSLMQVAASGSPPNGHFLSSLENGMGGGTQGLAGLSMVDSQNGTATLKFSDPISGGSPTAGGLAQISVSYISPQGASSAVDIFTVPTFGMSCYMNALETDYMTAGHCSDGQNPTSAPGITGSYCPVCLGQVQLRGSGFSANNTAIQYDPGDPKLTTFRRITPLSVPPVL